MVPKKAHNYPGFFGYFIIIILVGLSYRIPITSIYAAMSSRGCEGGEGSTPGTDLGFGYFTCTKCGYGSGMVVLVGTKLYMPAGHCGGGICFGHVFSSNSGGGGGCSTRRRVAVPTAPPTPSPTPMPNTTMRTLAVKVPSGGAYTGACEGSPSARRVYEYLSSSDDEKNAWDPEDEREKFASFSSYLSGTNFSASSNDCPYAVIPQTQSGGTPVSLGVWQGYHYTLNGSYTGETYVPKKYCRILSGQAAYTEEKTLYPTAVVATQCKLTDPPCFLVAFTEPTGWYQVNGNGNSYAKTSLADQIPSAAVTAGATYDLSPVPGIVTSPIMDFTINPDTTGEDIISSSALDLNVKRSFAPSDLYTTFSYRLQDATKSASQAGKDKLAIGEQPLWENDRETNAYYHDGDLTIGSRWNINSDQKYIIIVTGNLTISSPVTLAAGATNAFLMFLVKGDIAVSATVGRAKGSVIPVVEGIYITNGTFKSGVSTDPATERLVLKGSVIADSIVLERSLTGGQNSNSSAELFIFNPDFLFSFPKIIKDLPYTWQEVAP